jgi:hypothetical protein
LLSTLPLSGDAAFGKARLKPRNRFQDAPGGVFSGPVSGAWQNRFRHQMRA